ncbi:hypothetical protein WICMUC_003210 [Wickerhamomyces mucosus]|uniref:Uncharacterized protein n=1 Tax=Wickerhamomyces mucosus TaxID=1378264 RepID=A0A9P8PLM0_9ASCO|nr:hypothetical protein WICMUC_003210 [Wickerhamomyces mucosus]
MEDNVQQEIQPPPYFNTDINPGYLAIPTNSRIISSSVQIILNNDNKNQFYYTGDDIDGIVNIEGIDYNQLEISFINKLQVLGESKLLFQMNNPNNSTASFKFKIPHQFIPTSPVNDADCSTQSNNHNILPTLGNPELCGLSFNSTSIFNDQRMIDKEFINVKTPIMNVFYIDVKVKVQNRVMFNRKKEIIVKLKDLNEPNINNEKFSSYANFTKLEKRLLVDENYKLDVLLESFALSQNQRKLNFDFKWSKLQGPSQDSKQFEPKLKIKYELNKYVLQSTNCLANFKIESLGKESDLEKLGVKMEKLETLYSNVLIDNNDWIDDVYNPNLILNHLEINDIPEFDLNLKHFENCYLSVTYLIVIYIDIEHRSQVNPIKDNQFEFSSLPTKTKNFFFKNFIKSKDLQQSADENSNKLNIFVPYLS